ncbi:MAG: type 2 lantipeptide synthetase LanM family protein [Lachnospiraceae bacterium]
MKEARGYYIRERKYGEQNKINLKTLEYWTRILKDVDLSIFPQVYKMDLEKILFSDTIDVIDTVETKRIHELERQFEEWKDQYKEKKVEKKNIYFEPFYNLFMQFALDVLRDNVPDLKEEVIRSFTDAVLQKIGSVSLRILIQELHICKESMLLHGNVKEQYEEYCEKYLSDIEYIEELFHIYPVLKRLVFEIVLLLSERYQEFILRFRKDIGMIKDKFSLSEEDMQITYLRSDTSDSHNKGETVFIVSLSNEKKLVYKSRSLKAEIYLQEVISFIENGLNCKLKKVNLIDCGDYGWEEFIETRECNNKLELKRYYYRFGVLIFISYLLNANDLHEENVIADGEYPVIIDGETILNNWIISEDMSARDSVNDMIRNSVLLSGLLPKRSYTKKGKGIDMSAIGGQGGQEFPFQIPEVVDAFTSDMRLEYINPNKGEKNNLVKLQGTYYSPYTYMTDIVQGFSDAYIYSYLNKIELCNLIKQFADLEVRHLVQDTQKYGMLLHLSYHPDFMQDGFHRELFLCSLFKNVSLINKPYEIVDAEIEDMLHMDIPYFKVKANETILRNGRGKYIKDYFSDTCIEKVCKKIMQLDMEDKKQQELYIRIVLDNTGKTRGSSGKILYEYNKNDIANHVHKTNCIKAVQRIADYYLEKAVWGCAGKDVNWTVTMPIGDDDDFLWDIRGMAIYLYEGLAGIAIYFAAMNKYFKNAKYKEMLSAITRTLFEYTDDLLQNAEYEGDSGLFSGEAGLVYTYIFLYQISGECGYLDYAKKHTNILIQLIEQDQKNDIMYGNAGAILAFIGMYDLTLEEEYLGEAFRAGRVLVEAQKENGGWQNNPHMCPLAGMSHGAAGIIYALAKLWKYKKDDTILFAIKRGLEFENSLFVQEYGNWRDERYYKGKKISESNNYTSAWCHGAPGILLSRLRSLNLLDGEMTDIVLRDIRRSITTVYDSCMGGNNCLCHGNMGNTEIAKEYCKVFHDEKMKEDCELLRKNLIEKISQDENLGIEPFYGFQSLGFMNGLAGIGYSIMRELDNELPCVMAVDLR